MTAVNTPGASQRLSPRRFARLLRAQWAEQRKPVLALALVLLILLVLLALILLSMRDGDGDGMRTGMQMTIYYAGLLCSGYVVASLVFTPLGRPEANLLYLMRPAATLEKWLAAALALLLLWPLLYTAVFALVMGPASALGFQQALGQYHAALTRGSIGAVTNAMPVRADWALFWPFAGAWGHADESARGVQGTAAAQLTLALVYAGVTAYPMLFGLYFRRYAAIKALALGFALFIATLLLLSLSDTQASVLAWWDWTPEDGASWPRAALCVAFWLGVPALLWAASYHALRERDMA